MQVILSVMVVTGLHVAFYAFGLPDIPAHVGAIAGGCVAYGWLHRETGKNRQSDGTQ
jgi:hypothetical protein